MYQPHQNLCIDEGMVPWRGNLHFRVYSPDKPDKYGLKAYILCDAENGYCLKMKLYTGKPSVPPSDKGATYDLVMSLLRNHYACGHILYCDNYYSSPQLFMDLWCLGVGATGTVRPNRRGIPQEIKEVSKLVIVAFYFPIWHKLICSKIFILCSVDLKWLKNKPNLTKI